MGDIPVSKTYVVAITNSILKNSKWLHFEKQQALVENNGCEVPGLLEMIALNILTYISSPSELPTRLFGINPVVYSRCKEDDGDYRFTVGNFSSELFIRSCDLMHDEIIGVAGLRKI